MNKNDADIIRHEFGVNILERQEPERDLFSLYKINRVLDDTPATIERIKKSEKNDNLQGSLNKIAEEFLTQGRINIASEFSKQSMDLIDDSSKPLEKARAWSIGGKLAYLENDYAFALELFSKAFDIYRELKDKANIVSSIINIGNVFKKLNRWDEALEHYRKALEIAKSSDDRYHIAAILNNMGNIHLKLNHLHEAVEYYQKTLELIENSSGTMDNKLLSSALNNLGLVYKNQGDYDKALKYFEKAGELCLGSNCKDGEITLLINTANIDCQKSNFETALEKINLALAIIEKSGMNHLRKMAILSKSMIYESMGDYKQALELYRNYAEMSSITKPSSNCSEKRDDVYKKKPVVHCLASILSKNENNCKTPESRKMINVEMSNLRKQSIINIKRISRINLFIDRSINTMYKNLATCFKDIIPENLYQIHQDIAMATSVKFEEIFFDQAAFVIYLQFIEKYKNNELLQIEENALHFLNICYENQIQVEILLIVIDLLREINQAQINVEKLLFNNNRKHTTSSLLIFAYWLINGLYFKSDEIIIHKSDEKNTVIPRKYFNAFKTISKPES